MSETCSPFCPIPWMHFVLDGNKVSPCCRMAPYFEPVEIPVGDKVEIKKSYRDTQYRYL